MSTFLESYIQKVFSSLDNDFEDNWDEFRFGSPDPVATQRTRSKPFHHAFLEALGLTTGGAAKQKVGTCKNETSNAFSLIAPHIANLEWLHASLVDKESLQTLVDVVAYRALGHRKIKLAVNCPAHWENLRIAESLVCSEETIDPKFMHFMLNKLDLNRIGIPITAFWNPMGVVIDFMQEQYRCQSPDGPIECSLGDYVIDAGGCWGDTALYFAHKSGPSGKVYSFEFLEDNLRIFHRNLSLNECLAKNIQIIQNPVWSKSGEDVAIAANGPGTHISHGGASDKNLLKFKTLSIDDLVNSGSIEKADFIKMDIEGAELNALKGAEETIRRFKPKLAITVYHSLNDFWEIPEWLESLGLGYKFYLRHFTIHAEETVLFASAR